MKNNVLGCTNDYFLKWITNKPSHQKKIKILIIDNAQNTFLILFKNNLE